MKENNFVCTGDCITCGRCFTKEEKNEEVKKGTMVFPKGFQPDLNVKGLGLSFDIGTTTLGAFLWDLEERKLLRSTSDINPQGKYGTDIISRITYIQRNPEGLKHLREILLETIHSLKDDLLREADKSEKDITKVTFAGNTLMSHILLNKDPIGLATAPFKPSYEGSVTKTGKKFKFSDNTEIYVLANIAGHVGGDITAGVLASSILNKEGSHLFIDLGTNGEIALVKDGKGVVCSTAAGPAFEAASLSCGTRAVKGAIDKIEINTTLKVHTIGDEPPIGICGTGAVSVVSELLRSGLMDKTGRLESDTYIGKTKHYILSEEEDVYITQKDIRELQLAKGALRAGLEILMKNLNLTFKDLTSINIAGAFGNTIDIEAAINIGILPDIERNKFNLLGNGAGTGACMVLLSKPKRDEAETIPHKLNHVELADQEDFQELFLHHLNF